MVVPTSPLLVTNAFLPENETFSEYVPGDTSTVSPAPHTFTALEIVENSEGTWIVMPFMRAKNARTGDQLDISHPSLDCTRHQYVSPAITPPIRPVRADPPDGITVSFLNSKFIRPASVYTSNDTKIVSASKSEIAFASNSHPVYAIVIPSSGSSIAGCDGAVFILNGSLLHQLLQVTPSDPLIR